MANLFTYYTGTLSDLVKIAMQVKDKLIKKKLGGVSSRLIEDLAECGVVVDAAYNHVVDNNAIRHAYNQHAVDSENLRGQMPITIEDIEEIPNLVENYDDILTHKNRRGQDVIVYSKACAGGITIYVEEIRVGRKELAMDTIYKRKNGKRTDANE